MGMKTVGMVGIGLMGHGIAGNLVRKGWNVVLFDHPGNHRGHQRPENIQKPL